MLNNIFRIRHITDIYRRRINFFSVADMAGNTSAALGHSMNFALFYIESRFHHGHTHDVACPENSLSADAGQQYAFYFSFFHDNCLYVLRNTYKVTLFVISNLIILDSDLRRNDIEEVSLAYCSKFTNLYA